MNYLSGRIAEWDRLRSRLSEDPTFFSLALT